MDNNESPLIKEEIFSIQNELFQKAEHNVYLASPSIGAKDRLVREKLNNLKQKSKEKHELMDSLEGCDVSVEIMGEWNVIRNDIRDLLSKTSYEVNGYCTRLLSFVDRAQEHLKSIREKVGKTSIEYQMISAIIAQAIVLDCESNMIEAEPIKGFGAAAHGDYVASVVYNRALKDCLAALSKASLFDLEYQYKVESFTPTYTEFKEKGKRAGLIEEKTSSTKSNTGCLGFVALGIVTTSILLFIL